MNASDIVNVSEQDFEYQVLAYSQRVPVVVDFWAEWCVPCKVLGPILEKLTVEAAGGFRLAKVDIDQNPNLARQYNVHGIPAVKAFRDGRVVSEFSGALPEPRIREFFRTLLPNPVDLAVEKGNSLLQARQPVRARDAFRSALEEEPGHPAAMLGLSRSLLLVGENREARQILQSFPSSPEMKVAEVLRPLADMLVKLEQSEIDPDTDDPLDAAFAHALRLFKRGNLPAALDGLLDILRQNKRYRSGQARQAVVAMLDLLGDENPMTREYRSELASILF
jgi:putative thioredoxin